MWDADLRLNQIAYNASQWVKDKQSEELSDTMDYLNIESVEAWEDFNVMCPDALIDKETTDPFNLKKCAGKIITPLNSKPYFQAIWSSRC